MAVLTTSGPVDGGLRDRVHIYRGIPYGNAGRFEPPAPARAWTTVLDATHPGPRAVQVTPEHEKDTAVAGPMVQYFAGGDPKALRLPVERNSEDCLVLNVVTPTPDAGGRPVMVYVHGGGFDSGSGQPVTWATRMVREQDVVLVGVNHRLNVFGFLHLEDLDASFAGSGNAGMLDLVLALRWVRDNIAAFGGDPDNVTVFGESGGGAKISALLAMPDAAGLFHRAAIQSGSRLGAFSREQATRQAEELLAVLGCVPAELRTLPAEQLLEAATTSRFAASPVIDGRALPRAPFEPDAPDTAVAVPLLLGHCLDEMSMFVAGLSEQELVSRTRLPGEVLDRLESAYTTAFPSLSRRRNLVRILSDQTFGNAVHAQAERKAVQPAPVHKYVFTAEPPLLGGALGAFHTAELPLVLGVVRYEEMDALSRLLAGAWASFARTGDPSSGDLEWPRFDVADRRTMVFGDDPRVVSDPFGTLRRAWDGIESEGMDGLLRGS